MNQRLRHFRVAVILALAEEYEIFRHYFRGEITQQFHLGELRIDVMKLDGIEQPVGVVCVNRMGNVASGIAAARVLEAFDVDLIVNLGIAAGTKRDSQSLGDIVLADKIRYYEFGKQYPDHISVAPDYSDLRSSYLSELLQSGYSSWDLGKAKDGSVRHVHVGTIASGEKVISDSGFVDQLLEFDRKTVGIEMESYGIASAVFGRPEKFLMIRGICDFADEKKDDSARLNAMEGATQFFKRAVEHGLFKPRKDREERPPGNFVVTYISKDLIDGVPNIFLSLDRKDVINNFHYRNAIIKKMDQKFNMGTLRSFCVALGVDFDNLPCASGTKIEKIASLIDHAEKQLFLTIQDIEQLIDSV